MRRGLAVPALLLLILPAFAGCLDQSPGSGPTGVEPGDLVRVRFVERFADGTVHNATVPGDLPPNATLQDLPPDDHREVWWLVWTERRTYPSGQDRLTQVQLLDLDGDGRHESVSRVRHDVSGDPPRQTLSDQTFSLWNLPPGVSDPGPVPAPGLHPALIGRREGDRIEGIRLEPEQAFGDWSEDATTTLPRLQDRLTDLPRTRRNLTETVLRHRTNYTEATEVGDLLSYRLPRAGGTVDARVERLNGSVADLYLLVRAGQNVSFSGLWNATIVDLDDETFSLRHHPILGSTFRWQGSVGRVIDVNATRFVVDFNDLRTGHTMVYDVEIVEVRRFQEGRDLWSRSADPLGDDGQVHDVAVIAQSMPAIATSRGVSFTPTSRWGEAWFRLSPDLEDRRVSALEVSPADPSTVYAVVADRGIRRSEDHGRSWSDPGGELPEAAADLTASGADVDRLYALLEDGRIVASGDGGRSWSGRGDAPSGTLGLDAGFGEGELWAATSTGLQRSDDGGGTWSNSSLRHRRARDVVVASEAVMYASMGRSVFRSLDGGGSWTAQGNGPFDRLAALHDRPTWLLGSGPGGSVSMSQQAGAAWLRVPTR